MDKKQVSVIISFYNNLMYLKLVLAGFKRQSFKNFEIIIADDGSKSEIVEQLKEYITNSSLDIVHVWHDDNGWQKNIILNKGIIASSADYLVFIDGDCIPHKHFVLEHHLNKEENMILAGRRANLSKYITDKLTEDNVQKGVLEKKYAFLGLISQIYKGGSHLENMIYFKSNLIRKYINRKDKGLLGSNFSLCKKDILEVNGFDERYKNPAIGEDTDLEYRLRNAGKKVKTVKHLSIQYHLFHKRLHRHDTDLSLLNQVVKNNTTFTPFGIIKT